MTTINCSWEQYKQAQKEFHEALPTLNEEEADSALKCLALHYFGMSDERYAHSCFIAFKIASKECLEHLASLSAQQVPL